MVLYNVVYMFFLGENEVIVNNQCQIWVCRSEISYKRGIIHAYHLGIKQTPPSNPQKHLRGSSCFGGLITQFK